MFHLARSHIYLSSDENLIAFKICYGHFEYQVMLFRLTNVLATFWGYINKILVEKHNVLIIGYLDNIFIYTKNEGKEHIEAI